MKTYCSPEKLDSSWDFLGWRNMLAIDKASVTAHHKKTRSENTLEEKKGGFFLHRICELDFSLFMFMCYEVLLEMFHLQTIVKSLFTWNIDSLQCPCCLFVLLVVEIVHLCCQATQWTWKIFTINCVT